MPEKYLWMIELWPFVGEGPAQKVMKEIKAKDASLHQFIQKKIRWFMQQEIGQVIRTRYLKDLKNGLWELVVTTREGEFRMLGVVEYPIASQPQFVCLLALLPEKRTESTARGHGHSTPKTQEI